MERQSRNGEIQSSLSCSHTVEWRVETMGFYSPDGGCLSWVGGLDSVQTKL